MLELFLEFFKTGLFAMGGGLATLPFLYKMAEKYSWITNEMIADMIAVSESTPGPLGVNMATYTGFMKMGVVGGVTATLSLVLPSFLVVIIISRFLDKYKCSLTVENMFKILRPAVTGLIASAGFSVIIASLFNKDLLFSGIFADAVYYKCVILFVVLFFAIKKLKWHPIFFITASAVVGIIFSF
ncbi:hypothetical protein SDC9_136605 [bioreactor metagenome]|uniref:Chromate transport protein n=1 Tax=bioreactor metagenome TaxID=1076179 RepID=A0A645DJL4_9ZZZZ|nr:chromate transporter [Lachnospiraceae bacterium]